ncbi:MAG TPA: lysine 6-aminotransferase, partial [Tahibacter sp.]|nr:lysine 6-aminotransferase [Tahibacter sp.]
MQLIDKLAPLRNAGGHVRTRGLDDATIARFAATSPELVAAIDLAVERYAEVVAAFPELVALDEAEQMHRIQADFVNFYAEDAVNPYVALAASGPWVVTLKGAVLHDSGGYGMLGFGHAPPAVIAAMSRPQVMANIMTPNVAHLKLGRALRGAIGAGRGGCPYTHFLCLNSGSESVSLAGR